MKRLFALVLSLALLLSLAPVQAEKPYAGTELRVLLANHMWSNALEPHLKEFEELTGIKLNVEMYAEDQLSQKLAIELAGQSKDLDVFMTRPLQEAKQMIANGWLYDVTPLLNDEKMDKADFFEATLALYNDGDKYFGVPLVTEREILYYRTDLFEEAGLQVPTTLDELWAAAEALTDVDAGVYGIVSRGLTAAAVTQFSGYLYSMGGDWMDAEGNAAINTPEAVKALKFYGDMLREFGPPGVTAMHWQQCAALYASGKAAMYTEADAIFNNAVNAAESVVADKTGYALFPGDSFYNIPSWGLSMGAFTEKADAAAEFVKWAAGKEMTATLQAAGVPGARISVYGIPEANVAFPPQLVEVIGSAGTKNTKGYDRPLITSVSKARDYIGQAIVAAIEGGDVQAAADEANRGFQSVIEEDRAAEQKK
ncbi:MAG: sugar ABC transporter substrate-binding protein [Clostridiales bacterium]|nr:sugar ABC transporter substrate-binding protein [Clostridiales bacterium]